jgi:hypothetical protein
MAETRKELEEKAARYRTFANDMTDRQTAERILALADELDRQARELSQE